MKQLYLKTYGLLSLSLVGIGLVSFKSFTGKQTLVIENGSNLELRQLYLSSPNANQWGTNLLSMSGFEELLPNESLSLELECGTWDVKLVGEGNKVCILRNIKFCKEAEETWRIPAQCP